MPNTDGDKKFLNNFYQYKFQSMTPLPWQPFFIDKKFVQSFNQPRCMAFRKRYP